MANDLQVALDDICKFSSKGSGAMIIGNEVENKASSQKRCIHELFEEQVERTPGAVALLFERQQFTYRELDQRANQLAHYLQSLGVGPEVLVGICLERSVDLVVGLLAVLKAGGAYVPLDPAYPQERLTFLLQDSQAGVVLTQERFREQLVEGVSPLIFLEQEKETINQQDAAPICSGVQEDNLAYVIYTSGSTGRPKGVAIEHRSTVVLLHWAAQLFAQQLGGVLAATSICFDLSVFELFAPLCWGGRVILAENALQLPWLVARQEVQLLNTVPSVMAELLRQGGIPDSVRIVNLAGEPLPPALAQKIYQHETIERVYNLYGPTEDTTYSTCAVLTRAGRETRVPIGRPLPNTQVYVLDTYLQPVAPGAPGELYLGGAGLARGYLNRPDLTEERFIRNPFSQSPGARLYKTGDLVRLLPDGNLEYLGRLDHQVKLRGFRIELGEIEAVLGQHPLVEEVVVVAREDALGEKRLVAYVVTLSSEVIRERDLQAYLQKRLPGYMVPSAFVSLERLPLTVNGKVDRQRLPAPQWTNQVSKESWQAPYTDVEQQLAAIWTEVLGVESVGRHDDFFALGGHSLLAIRVMARIRELLSVELSLSCIFEMPTIEELASSLEAVTRLEQPLPPILPMFHLAASPLSFAQQRLWLMDQLTPGNPAYNTPFALRFKGKLHQDTLLWSLNQVIQRHQSLCIHIEDYKGEAAQILSPTFALEWSSWDLREQTAIEQRNQVQCILQREANHPFNLKIGPLIRAGMLLLQDEEQILVVNLHHIISDGWSLEIFKRDLAAFYRQAVTGIPAHLPDLPVHYRDFALWQRTQFPVRLLEQQLTYWRKQLAGAPGVLQLPTDRPRPAVQSFAGANYEFQISSELTQALRQLSQQEGNTLFMTLLAAFQVLLYRYSGQEDVLVGTPIANRTHRELEDLIGFFVNTVVLRTNLADSPTFRELLRRVRKVALEAYAHADVPFERVVEEVQPERNASYNPLFQVMFALQSVSENEMNLPELHWSPVEIEKTSAQFDLTLELIESGVGLKGQFEYSTALFEPSTIKRLADHLLIILESITKSPDQQIGEMPLLTESEQNQLLTEWNATQTDYPRECVHHLFEAQAEHTPEAIAVVHKEEQLTYGELNRKANQLAHYLQALGVGPEVFVGLCVERSIEMIVGLLAILKAGGAYIPLDPTYPADRLAFMLQDSQVGILLTQEHLLAKLPECQARLICLDSTGKFTGKLSEANPQRAVRLENLAYIIYTSGSTGRPKGVLIEHKGLCNVAEALSLTFHVQPESRILQFASLSFDASVFEILMALLAGASLYLRPSDFLEHGSTLNQLLRDQAITNATLTPSVLESLSTEEFPHLHTIVVAGEKCSTEIIAHWAPNRRFFNAYGPTETTIWASTFTCTPGSLGSIIGRPIANTQLYVLDRRLQPVPIGVSGELFIGGAGLARGYLNRPELTDEKFLPNPFDNDPRSRLYRTGDLVRYLPNGNLEFLGRVDHQVKIRGIRIELGEIEAILHQYGALRDALVVAREDDEGLKRLIAYVVVREPGAVEEHDLRAYLRERLPGYMVPSAFVLLEQFPLTVNGKVDRRLLPIPRWTDSPSEKSWLAPRTQSEQKLATIWGEVLKCQTIGVHDDFFALGGHSLLAAQAISRIKDVFGVEIPLSSLFEMPTITGLASSIVQKQAEEADCEILARLLDEVEQC